MPFDGWLARAHRLLPLLLLSVGCSKLFAKDAPAPAPAPAEVAGAIEASEASAHAAEKPDEKHADEPSRPARYGVPFAWQASPEEPLAKARTFMAEVLRANQAFMSQGKSHFIPFAEEETPRATVLTCADSRVQAGAWDGSPENDGYTVRNLGNQLATSLGSVEYGVDRLHTPVLLIIGHTGCDAVQSVLDKSAKGKGPLADELAHLDLPERFRRVRQDEDWSALTKAVVANVDAQVAGAVEHFSASVQSGDLTVVGAVYDLHDDFDDGHGRLRLVNVNSNTEDSRIEAFQKAVEEGSKPAPVALGQRRPMASPLAPLIDRTGRPLPGGPRASINAVSVLGSGNFDAVSSGTVSSGSLRQPSLRAGSSVPGTSDLKLAPGYRPPAAQAARSEHAPSDHDLKAAADHGTPSAHGKTAPGDHDAAPPARGKAAPAHEEKAGHEEKAAHH